MKGKRFLALTCAFLIAGCNIAFAHADDELFKTVIIKDGTELSVLDCVATAFHNSPKIKRKKYYLDIAKSNAETVLGGMLASPTGEYEVKIEWQ